MTGPKAVPAEERVGKELLDELREQFERKAALERAATKHNEVGAKINEDLIRASAVFEYVYAKAKVRYDLSDTDGIDLTAGIIQRGVFPVASMEATGQ